MAFGTLGSTLNDELNRLANGGTYRDSSAMVDEALAAKQWANRENIVPYSTDTVGILNEIAALGPNRQNWYDFNGVCNYLAGTTGLPAAAALRQITTTGDILTSLAAFYTDAATPRYNYPGYIYLPGIDGRYIATPDAAALDITGDLTIVAKANLDNWSAAPIQSIVRKGGFGPENYGLYITNGQLVLSYNDGTWRNRASGPATVPFANGTDGWIKVTFDADNGASGCDVKFYTSTDGSTWTQLGTTKTFAGVATLSTNALNLTIGSDVNGLEVVAGRIYRAQVFASINDTNKVFDADLTTNVTSATYDQFTATTGQLCTIVGQNTLTNGGSAGSLLPVTVGSSLAADSNDAKFLDHTGTNYVYGIDANNGISVPDVAALDITGDIDLRAYIAMDDWTPAASMGIFAKSNSTTTFSYGLRVETAGTISFRYSTDGTTTVSRTSTVAPTVADGAPLWVRATLDADNGAAGHTVTFYTSNNGTTWTQLGSPVVTAGTVTMYSGAGQITSGTVGNAASGFSGKIYKWQIFSDITETNKVLDVDTSVITSGADTYVVPTTYTGQTGAYFTGSGLSLNGVAGNYVSTPDYAAIDITGDIDIQCKVALTDWTPVQANSVIGKYLNTGNQRSYELEVGTDGRLTLAWSANGTTPISKTSTVAPTVANGATLWIRATLDVDNGASGNNVKFFTSDDGTTWTQLGDTVTTAGTTSIYVSSAPLEVGSVFAGTTQPVNGTVYRAIVKSGIDGYTVFDADFTQVPANALRMTESSINKAVVTLNTTRYATIYRSTSGRKTVAVTQPTWLFGTDDYMEVNNRYMDHTPASENYVYLSGASGNYMSVSDAPPLDVTGDIDVRVKAALDSWTGSFQTLAAKWNVGNQAFVFHVRDTSALQVYWSENNVNVLTATSTATLGLSAGATKWVRFTLDVDNGAGGSDFKFWTSDDGTNWTQLGATVVKAVTNIYANSAPVEIGAYSTGTALRATGKFYRAIIKNGIDGTTVLDANAATITLPSQTTFTDSSSNAYTVTINKSGVGTFVSTGNYLYLPGIASNNASAPDAAVLDITGDIDLRCKVSLDDWTPATQMALIAKDSTSNRSYYLHVNTNGQLVFGYSTDGTNVTQVFSTVATGIADGATKWVRATMDVNNGASGNSAQFFTSDDGLTWTQLGTTVTAAGTLTFFSGTSPLYIGTTLGTGVPARAKFFRAQVLNGIGGTVAFDANFEGSITSLNQASFTESSSNAATVTINRSGSTYRSAGVIDAGYLYPGATNTFSNSTIDYLNFGATNSFTLVLATRIWNTPLSNQRMFFKGSSEAGQGGARYGITTNTTLFQFNAQVNDGTNGASATSPTSTNGQMLSIASVTDRTNQTMVTYTNAVGGSSVSTSAVGSLSNPNRLRLGWGDGATQGNYADMEVYGAAVFRSVLTPAQIRQISNYFANREAYL